MTTLEWAELYVSIGWKIFPLHSINDDGQCTCGTKDCGDAGKHPKGRRGLKDATDDLEKIREWFADESSNIGLATGEISGITVIDVDTADGKAGAASYAELIAEKGEPDTLIAQTGSGGMHLVFKYNSAVKTASNVLGPGIDSRNDGGYIVACPSRHRSGGVYSWLNWEDAELGNLPAHMAIKKDGRGRPKGDDLGRKKYTIEQVRGMLKCIPADDRDRWRAFGIILGRTFNRIDEAWALYHEWSDSWGGEKGRNHNEIMHEAFYVLSAKQSDKDATMGSIVHCAIENGWAPAMGEVPVEHFIYFAPGNSFVYRPTSAMWVAGAVNVACSPVNEAGKIVKPADWLQQNMLATSMTSDPILEGDYIKGQDCREGVLVEHKGAAIFNAYRGPSIELGDSRMAQPFLKHVAKVFPKDGDADQFLDFMAHRVQRPWEKPRFALLIAGDQGVGKDTAVEFCCPAIGSWNVSNIDPSALDSGFNEFAASVLVRVSETANMHDMNKWAFNERMKVLIAGSPDNMMINPKYGQKYSVRMHCGVILTTNHLTTGIYIPPDDRRYDVIEAATKEEMGLGTSEASREYFGELWDWFVEGGDRHVAAYLFERKLNGFSAANGQRKTDAHRSVVLLNMSADSWAVDAIDELQTPVVVRVSSILRIITKNGGNEREASAKIQNVMTRLGYSFLKNPNRADGRWVFDGKKKSAVYVKRGTSVEEINKLWPLLDSEPF
jgi:hypothetical protein